MDAYPSAQNQHGMALADCAHCSHAQSGKWIGPAAQLGTDVWAESGERTELGIRTNGSVPQLKTPLRSACGIMNQLPAGPVLVGDHFHVFTDGTVAFGTKWAHGISYEIRCRGTSNPAIVAWIKKHITTGSFDPANVICHGMMLKDDQMKKNDVNIFFIRDADFISRIHFVKA